MKEWSMGPAAEVEDVGETLRDRDVGAGAVDAIEEQNVIKREAARGREPEIDITNEATLKTRDKGKQKTTGEKISY